MGEATLELLEEFPAYRDLLWERVSSLTGIRGDVLEMGCGIGSISRMILRSPLVRSLDAVDIEPAYLSRVVREIPDPRLRTICSAAEDFEPRAESYDLVVSINVLEHVRDDQTALRGFARALRPDGVCLVLVPAHPWLFSSLDAGSPITAGTLAPGSRHLRRRPAWRRDRSPISILWVRWGGGSTADCFAAPACRAVR